MTITVCIMSYKYGHLAESALLTVLSQTRRPDKIIFVDDGANDCEHLIDNYKHRVDSFIVREKNLGIVENFQKTLEMVDTDKVLFLGADNYLAIDTLENLEKSNADIVSYDIFIVGEEADAFIKKHGIKLKNNNFNDKIWETKGMIHGSSLYNVELAKKAGGYRRNPTSIKTEEDKMLFEAMIKEGATHEHISEPFLFYNRHKENFQGL